MSYNIRQIAELLHKEYELKAHKIGWATNEECRLKPFDDLPPFNKAVMLHVAEWVFNEIEDEKKRSALEELKEVDNWIKNIKNSYFDSEIGINALVYEWKVLKNRIKELEEMEVKKQ